MLGAPGSRRSVALTWVGRHRHRTVAERIVSRMTSGLKRFHESGQSHFLTFSCYQRRANFASPDIYNLRAMLIAPDKIDGAAMKRSSKSPSD